MTRTIKRTECKMDRHPESGIGVMETSRGILPLRSLDVQAKIFGLGSKSVIRQTFFNSYDEAIEATYIFPLPGRDAVTRFVMHVNGREIEGELQERGQAREVYDKAIEAGHAAAIAEEERSETFTMRVGNIPPGEQVSIEMTLVGQLPIAGDEATFRFPLVVAPRYVSGKPLDGKSVGDGVACDTDRVPDASRVTPPVLIPGMPNPVDLSIEVDIHLPESFDREKLLSQLTSSLHTVVVNDAGVADGMPLKVRLQPGERLNRDFILRFPFLAEQNSCSLLAAKDGFGSSVFSVNIVPPDSSIATKASRDVVFVLDRSGSMQGWKMVAARRAVARMIDSMRDVDRFAVMAFDTSIEYPGNGEVQFFSGTDRNRWDAVQWVGSIESRGGTKLEEAIIASLKLHRNPSADAREPVVVLITDGQVAAEDAVLKAIESSGDTRKPTFFCLGIDKAVNHGLLTRIAKLTSGTCETVESENQLDKVMERFHREIGSPVLTDITIKGKGLKICELTPQKKINVFADRPISIFGIANNVEGPFEISVTGKLADGRIWKTKVASKQADTETLHALWGRERLRDLEDEYVSLASSKLQKQIIAVSLKSNVLSRFTSYVAVDRSRVVNEGELPHKVVQPVESVEDSGLTRQLLGSIFGRATTATPAKPLGRSMKMAKAKRRSRGRSSEDFGAVSPSPAASASPVDSDHPEFDGLEILSLDCVASFSVEDCDLVTDKCDELSADQSQVEKSMIRSSSSGFDGDEDAALSEEETMLEGLDDASVGFAGTTGDDGATPSDRVVGLIELEATKSGASAIFLQRVDQENHVEFVINGVASRWERIPIQNLETVSDHIKVLAGLEVSETGSPQIGSWVGANGITWTVFAFADLHGNSIVLLADSAKNASLSI